MSIMENSLIYHYTSIEALVKILAPFKKKGHEGQICIRATHARFMNDPLEYEYAMSFIKESMIEYEKINNISDRKSDCLFSGKSDFFKRLAHTPGEPFIFSFSEQPNDLSMWRAYGKDGNGVNIGFDRQKLNEYIKDSAINSVLVPCNYDRERTFEDMIDYWNKNYSSFSVSNGVPSMNLKSLEPWITFLKLCFGAKQQPYSIEKEFRLCTSCHDFEFKNTGNIIVPFIEHYLPKDVISKIVIGPCLDSIHAKKGLQLFLEKNSYPYDDSFILESKISYRQI
jgi:hypothetical protein